MRSRGAKDLIRAASVPFEDQPTGSPTAARTRDARLVPAHPHLYDFGATVSRIASVSSSAEASRVRTPRGRSPTPIKFPSDVVGRAWTKGATTMSSGQLETKKSGDFYWSKDDVRALIRPAFPLAHVRVASSARPHRYRRRAGGHVAVSVFPPLRHPNPSPRGRDARIPYTHVR